MRVSPGTGNDPTPSHTHSAETPPEAPSAAQHRNTDTTENTQAHQRTYLVTGSNGGIGRCVVAELTKQGHHVHAWDLPEHDLTQHAAVAQAIEEVETQAGLIDSLIHCAGVLKPDSALNPDAKALDASLAVNFLATVNICSAVARRMVGRKAGSIVVISSNAAATPRVGMAAYGASKAATTAWIRTLGLECAPHGVRCNVVSPGSTDTPMLRGMWQEGHDATPEVIAGNPNQFRLGIPLNRLAQPSDIANACIFLADAPHITMHDLRIDGGATLDQ